MTNYIDTEKLIDNIRIYKGIYKAESITFDAIAKIIEKQPTIDAVEVVRCKDCKYKTKMGFCLKLADHECFWNTPADFFCKWGEKE